MNTKRSRSRNRRRSRRGYKPPSQELLDDDLLEAKTGEDGEEEKSPASSPALTVRLSGEKIYYQEYNYFNCAILGPSSQIYSLYTEKAKYYVNIFYQIINFTILLCSCLRCPLTLPTTAESGGGTDEQVWV